MSERAAAEKTETLKARPSSKRIVVAGTGAGEAKDAVSTRARLLEAGKAEFSKRGFQGARVDEIARRAKVNKQLLYYYFESKSGLYVAVIESAYLRFRGNDKAIFTATTGVDAETALHRLVGLLFRRSAEFQQFQRLLQDVNISGTGYLQKMTGIREAYSVLIGRVADILERGVAEGRFRDGIDPKELYISLTGAISVRFTNAASLSYVLGIDLLNADAVRKSQEYAVDLILRGIKRDGAPN